AIELSSFEGVEVLLMISLFNREQPTSPYLQIFASPLFRPLVVEGSEGRKKIFEEAGKRVDSTSEKTTYYIAIFFFTSVA
ncbi:hypothetical protein HK096_003851, partial [Nowakowskiella sp. JEL0078]